MAVDKEDDGGEGSLPDPKPHPNLPKARKGKSCKGLLYYDTLLNVQSKQPICYGISESIPQVPSYIVGEFELKASKEVHSLQNFKYSCTGYSVHLSNDDNSTDLADKRTELPFCIGLELLLDKRNTQAGHNDPDRKKERDLADKQPATADRPPPVEPPIQTSKPFPWPSPHNGHVYLDSFTRNAKLVAASMKKNARRVVNHIKRSIDDIVR